MSTNGTTSPAGVKPAPGWYSDPQGTTRWWNGRQWTVKVAQGGLQAGPATSRTATVLAPAGTWDDEPGPVATALEPVATAIGRWKPAVPLDGRTWLVRAAGAVTIALLAGYLLFGRGSDPGLPASTTHFRALSASQKAAEVALTTSDLPPTLKAVPIAHGTALTGPGSTSLRLCGGRFSSEAHRLARNDNRFEDIQGNLTGAQEQTTVYAGRTWATRAMAEWRQAVAGCNQRAFTVYAETGRTPARYSGLTSRPVTGLPSATATTTTFRLDVKGGGTYYGVVILQQQGNTIDAMMLLSADKVDQATIAGVTTFAKISGAKLVSASAAGTGVTAS